MMYYVIVALYPLSVPHFLLLSNHSLKMLVMRRLLFVDVMAMILMVIDFGYAVAVIYDFQLFWKFVGFLQVLSVHYSLSNFRWSLLMVDVAFQIQLIVVAATIVAVVVGELPDGQTIVVGSMSRIMISFMEYTMVAALFIVFFFCAVLVTGLPSSASWQDLKVAFFGYGLVSQITQQWIELYYLTDRIT